jgi:predicted phage tail protein
MKTVMLYGALGKKYGRVHRLEVRNPAEALRAFAANYPDFRKTVSDGSAYKVLIGGKQAITEEEVFNPVGDKESIRFIPIVEGSGNNPVVRIVIGAVLSYFAPAWSGTFMGSAMSSMGSALILGGISQLLFPAPKLDGPADKPDNKASFIFNGAVNTSAQGNPVPVCYGRLIVGSQVISAGLSTEGIPV